MTIWEYKIFSTWTAEPGSEGEHLLREAEIDAFGEYGWELVAVVPLNTAPQNEKTPLELFFKRPAESSSVRSRRGPETAE